MPREAEAVHGLSSAFLRDKPVFAAIVQEFLDFIGDATLIIHNASFDVAFLNAHVERIVKRNLPRWYFLDDSLAPITDAPAEGGEA